LIAKPLFYNALGEIAGPLGKKNIENGKKMLAKG